MLIQAAESLLCHFNLKDCLMTPHPLAVTRRSLPPIPVSANGLSPCHGSDKSPPLSFIHFPTSALATPLTLSCHQALLNRPFWKLAEQRWPNAPTLQLHSFISKMSEHSLCLDRLLSRRCCPARCLSHCSLRVCALQISQEAPK